MRTKKIVLFIAVLSLAVLSCGVTVDMPAMTDIKTGPTETEEIRIPAPEVGSGDSVQLDIAFGAGELLIEPGAGDTLVEGLATFNVSDFRPSVKANGSQVVLKSGNLQIEGFPKLSEEVENDWDLQLGNMPIDLKISGGAYVGRIELGGLALTSLKVADGAADVEISFNEPNPETMHTLRYDTGASNVVLRELGNANFRALNFTGGAGNYELDFSGDMRDDASVIVEAGLSSLRVFVPAELNVRVDVEGGLSNVSTQGDWGYDGGRYTHAGDGPTLDITVKMGAGNMILEVE